MIPRSSIGLMCVLIVVVACAGGAGTATTSPGPTQAVTTSSPSAGATGPAAEIDRAFIDMMVPHHQSAIEMARLAQTRAEREELVTLADGIITAQEREIGQLKAWRLEWFGSDETPPMDAMPIMPGVEMPGMGHGMEGGTMDMTADIETLRTADPFDEAFMEAMIRHHESAIAAAQVILPQTQRPEIASLAQDVIDSQQAEIDQLQAWLAEWYPDPS